MLIERFLNRLVKKGRLTLLRPGAPEASFGAPAPGYPEVTLRFNDAKVGRDIALAPRLGFAEAYMDGRVDILEGGVMEVIALIRMNNPWEKGGEIEPRNRLLKGVRQAARQIRQWNGRRSSRSNVAHHYDLSARLYDLFLDAERQYSCAYWVDGVETLEQAQVAKMRHIAAKLDLKPGHKVLDIGCGWGGMALFLHRHFGVEVLGITLSTEQLALARQRARDEGVSDKVKFDLIDYRDVTGIFDRIVSVGMFEHVGTPNYEGFFRQCHNLLAPDGVMLLHTIGRMGGPGSTDAFTRKYIFPGGYIPALSEIMRASEPNRLIMTDCESLRLHYARTLRAWYDRCMANRAEIVALYDERFFRMWTFYLSGSTAAFEHGGMLNYQLQFARDRRALPVTRDYMLDKERALAGGKS